MARIRTVKPEFWSDEKLAECSLGARLLFIGTWNFADDEGRMEYSPKRLKMQVFPGDSIEVAPLVEELVSRSLVIVYRAENREFLAIPNFRKHQRIDHPRASVIPAPTETDSPNIQGKFQESSANDPRTLAPEGNGIEGNGMEGAPPPPVTAVTPKEKRHVSYAKKILATLGLTNHRRNVDAVVCAIELEVKQGKTTAAAYEFILARALQQQGHVISDPFYFVDWGKHRNPWAV